MKLKNVSRAANQAFWPHPEKTDLGIREVPAFSRAVPAFSRQVPAFFWADKHEFRTKMTVQAFLSRPWVSGVDGLAV